MKTHHSSLTRPAKLQRSGITHHLRRSRSGQALVTLLVFISTATIIVAAAVAVTIINSQATSKFAVGEEALTVAETGIENAVMKILRNPNSSYTGETLPVGNGAAQVTVTYSPDIVITSTGTVGAFVRKMRVNGTFVGDKFTVTSYNQID